MIPPCFYIHIFPSSLWPLTISNSSISDHPRRVFQLLAQTAHVCFHSRKRVHTRLSEKNRTQGHTRRNRGVLDGGGITTLGSFCADRKPCVARGVERQTLPLLGLGRGCSQRTQKAFGTAMRSCASLFRGVAAPLGCVIPLLFLSPHRWASRFCLATITACRERYSPVSHAGLLHASCHSLPFLCPVHSIHLPLIKLVNGKLDRQDRVE